MSEIRVEVDLTGGKVSIACPEGSFETILKTLEGFLPQLLATPVARRDTQANANQGQPPAAQNTGHQEHSEDERGKRAGSSKKPLYTLVEFGLNKDQEREFKTYYDSKKPQGQNDQVLSVMYWLQQNAARTAFEPNDIFTGLRKVGEKIPARIESVLSNLQVEGKVVRTEGRKYKLTHIGEDRVDKELPLEKASK